MSWLEKILPKTTKSSGRKEIPEGVWCETVRNQRRPEASRGEPQSGEQF